MNNEHDDYRRPSGKRDSRWTVSPGSLSDSFAEEIHDGPPTTFGSSGAPTRRRAQDIIDEVRGTPRADDYPTRSSIRRPDVPFEIKPRPSLRTDAEPRRGRHAAAEEGDRPEPTPVTRAPRAPLFDESTRVRPDLGEKKELTAASSSSRGPVLAGSGGVFLILLAGLIGGGIDLFVVDSVGIVTAICLTVGAAAAAYLTRKRDVVSVVVAPPLVFAIVAAGTMMLSNRTVGLTTIADAAISGFPAMALATGVAAVIGGIRLVTSRIGERP